MTPMAKGEAAAATQAAVPAALLNEGEMVILALKPSVWFIAFSAWPSVVLAAALAATAYFAEHAASIDIRPQLVLPLCGLIVLLQLLVGCCQWIGRLYVLTNVRVMRVKGVFKLQLYQCPLRRLEKVILHHGSLGKFCGVGSLFFLSDQEHAGDASWLHVAKPAEVYEVVADAVRRAKNQP